MVTAKLTRTFFNDKRTLGVFELLCDGEPLFSCYACENTVRGAGDPLLVKEWKMMGKTAIPYGSYDCKFTYSPKYKRNMWQIMDVPGFEGIRIHSGNTEDDSEGCILLGEREAADRSGILNSRKAVKEFEAIMARHGNNPFRLEIVKYEKH